MNKLKFKNKNIRLIVLIVSFLIFMYVYIFILLNTNIIFKIINRMNNKYESDTIIIYDDLINLVKINDYKDIKQINTTFVNTEIIEEKEIKIINNPIVYIYNTHDTEKYYLPFVSDYSITPSVKTASLILKDYLNDYGIEAVIQTKSINDYLKKNHIPLSQITEIGDYAFPYCFMSSGISEEDLANCEILGNNAFNCSYTTAHEDTLY